MKTNSYNVEFNTEVMLDGVEVEVKIKANISPYIPAKTYGDPYDCYPAEGGCVEEFIAIRNDTKEDVTNKLSEEDNERIDKEAMAIECEI